MQIFLRTLSTACDQDLRPPLTLGNSLWMKFCCRRRPWRLRTLSSPQTKERLSVKKGKLPALNTFHSSWFHGFNVGKCDWQSKSLSILLLLLSIWQPKNNRTSTVFASAYHSDENLWGEGQAIESERLLLHQVLCYKIMNLLQEEEVTEMMIRETSISEHKTLNSSQKNWLFHTQHEKFQFKIHCKISE